MSINEIETDRFWDNFFYHRKKVDEVNIEYNGVNYSLGHFAFPQRSTVICSMCGRTVKMEPLAMRTMGGLACVCVNCLPFKHPYEDDVNEVKYKSIPKIVLKEFDKEYKEVKRGLRKNGKGNRANSQG